MIKSIVEFRTNGNTLRDNSFTMFGSIELILIGFYFAWYDIVSSTEIFQLKKQNKLWSPN